MTEERMNEIKTDADKIVGAIVDLQLVVAHHQCIDSQEIREIIYHRLKDIANIAQTFRRADKRDVLNPAAAVKLKLVNSFNSLRQALTRDHLRGDLDQVSDSDLLVLANMAENISSSIRLLLAMNQVGLPRLGGGEEDVRPAA
ncbi:MAG: hypothetical protein ACOY32_15275 [Thermodesulfobacteriota bacterium]